MPKKKKSETAVDKVVWKLRRRTLATPPGELIGSEEELVSTYKVSRPTLRQAAALLSQEQVLTIKRGVGGGYFSRRPGARAVAHIAAVYLQSRSTKLSELFSALEPLNIEMAVLACRNRSPKMLAEWASFYDRDEQRSASTDFHEFLRSQVEFIKLLGAASENRILELFVLTLYDFCGSLHPSEDILSTHPDRVRDVWSRRLDLIKAIIDGDVEIARLTAQRTSRLFSHWLEENTEHSGQHGSSSIWPFAART